MFTQRVEKSSQPVLGVVVGKYFEIVGPGASMMANAYFTYEKSVNDNVITSYNRELSC